MLLFNPQVYNIFGSEAVAPVVIIDAPAHSSEVWDVDICITSVKSPPPEAWIAVHVLTFPVPVVIISPMVLAPTPYTFASTPNTKSPVSLSLCVNDEIWVIDTFYGWFLGELWSL